ncbi:substrate-binding periplasmic protein [Roseateles koreensis]|uniref:Transporter substrate-binding domain-containing protein n=1 Tax=Roseateles koreensis TaxID=2987526 RepID=A0ABT5KLX4_9BURK|nr:transporter substrate-binding domain-containing protein [Roseateles koreensis]MDC8783914.1 transporter substrate-binding domain-containing protein [Roseateles koreensis]
MNSHDMATPPERLRLRWATAAGLTFVWPCLSNAAPNAAPNAPPNAELKRVEPVRLGIGEWAPFFSADLPHFGVFAQVVSEAFAQQGFAVQYQIMPWKRALADVESGYLHGSPGWGLTPERAQKFLYSDPVILSHDALFFLKRRPLLFQRDEDLRDKLLGATSGYHYGPLIQQYEAEGILRVDRAPSDEASLRKLLLGRVDGLLMNREAGVFLLKTRFTSAEQAEVVISPRAVGSKTSHMVMSRALPEVPGQLKAFNLGLAELRQRGRVQELLRQYAPASQLK